MSDSQTKDAVTMAHELVALLEPIKDHGTEIDTGGGMGEADLWVKIGGVEWFITVRKSNNQIAKENA